MWKFICYNGTEFVSYRESIHEAIEDFITKTNLHQIDIKLIKQLD